MLLFLTTLLTVGPIYLALAKRRSELSLPVSFFVFLLLYFNVTLNAMRQWIAMALLFLAFVGIYNDSKPIRSQPLFILLIICAYFFHTSAVLAIIMIFIIMFIKGENIGLKICIVSVALIGLIVALNLMRGFLLSRGLIRYANYLGDGTLGFSFPQLILRLPFLLVSLRLYSLESFNKNRAGFYLCLSLISIVCGQFSTLTSQSGRISQYFDMFFIPAIGFLVGTVNSKSSNTGLLELHIDYSLVLGVFSIVFSIAYWFFSYVYMGVGETIPYRFYWG